MFCFYVSSRFLLLASRLLQSSIIFFSKDSIFFLLASISFRSLFLFLSQAFWFYYVSYSYYLIFPTKKLVGWVDRELLFYLPSGGDLIVQSLRILEFFYISMDYRNVLGRSPVLFRLNLGEFNIKNVWPNWLFFLLSWWGWISITF